MTLLQLVFGSERCLSPLQNQWVLWRALSIKQIEGQGAKFVRFSDQHPILMLGSVIVSSPANSGTGLGCQGARKLPVILIRKEELLAAQYDKGLKS